MSSRGLERILIPHSGREPASKTSAKFQQKIGALRVSLPTMDNRRLTNAFCKKRLMEELEYEEDKFSQPRGWKDEYMRKCSLSVL